MFRFYFLGDVHLGSTCCDETKLAETIEKIRLDPDARVFLLGDLCEYIPRGEWRFREQCVATWVDRDDVANSERDEIIYRLHPIAKKILGAIQGNHELELADTWNNAVHHALCSELGIRNLGYMALVRLSFQWQRGNGAGDRRGVDLLLHHGWGGGRSDGADANRFNDLERDYCADWVICGHTHRLYAAKTIQHRLSKQADGLDGQVRIRGRSGTFLKTVTVGSFNYPEKTAMRPLQTGALCVVYHPESNDAEAIV